MNGNRLVGIDDESQAPYTDLMVRVYELLKPHIAFFIISYLDETWLVLLFFQLLQGLGCELRKEHDNRYKRREGPYRCGICRTAMPTSAVLFAEPRCRRQRCCAVFSPERRDGVEGLLCEILLFERALDGEPNLWKNIQVD